MIHKKDLKKEIEYLNQTLLGKQDQINNLKKEVWKIKNPPKHKVGEELKGTKSIILSCEVNYFNPLKMTRVNVSINPYMYTYELFNRGTGKHFSIYDYLLEDFLKNNKEDKKSGK